MSLVVELEEATRGSPAAKSGQPRPRPFVDPTALRPDTLDRVALVAAFVVAAVAALAFVGWWFGLAWAETLGLGRVTMKANTSVCLFAASAAIALLSRSDRSGRRLLLVRAAAALPLLVGGATVAEYAFGWRTGLDQLLFRPATGSIAAPLAGRMSPLSAMALTLLGMAILGLSSRPRIAHKVAGTSLFLAGAVLWLGLLGYTFGVGPTYGSSSVNGISLQSLGAMLLLIFAACCLEPRGRIVRLLGARTPAGSAARLLLPSAVLVPTVFGILRIAGQRAGWFGPDIGTALHVLASIAVLGTVAWWQATTLDQGDDERTLSQEALQVNEARYRRLLEALPDALIQSNADGRILLANEQAERLFGYAGEQLVGRSVKDLVPLLVPELRSVHRLGAAADPRMRAIGEGIDLVALRSDGTEVAVAVSLSLVQIDDEPMVIASIRDISEQKKAEEIRAHLASIVETTDDPILATGTDGTIVTFNRAAQRMFDHDETEVVGRNLSILVPAGDASEIERVHDAVVRTGSIARLESAMLRRDGSSVPVALTVSPIHDQRGAVVGISTIARDITDQNRVQLALRENMLAIAGFDGYFKRLGPEWSSTLGYSNEELLAHRYIEFVHPDDLAATTVEASQAEKAGNTTFENRYRCKDGSYRWLRWSSTPYADTELIYATARDVTDQKLVDQALARQAEELSRSNSDLEQFAYVASHDLQEPLRAIGGFTQLLDRKYGPQLDDQARTYIGHTVEATARMETLIKDLLAYSRVQRKGGTLDAVDLNVILDRALQALSSAISQASAVISRDTLPTIIADPTQMGQLLQNLVGNALKFRNDGQAHVEIRAERHDDGWLFSVRDDGIGIDPAFTDRIFAIFQRLHTRTEYSGTGIGLAICKRIVERHGGRIWVESAEGAGCTFRFTVPDANGGER